MRTQGTAASARSGIAAVSRSGSGGLGSTVLTPYPPRKRLLQRKYQELVRKHFGHILDRLFAEFTGLHYHLAWAVALPQGWRASKLPSGCSACRRLRGSPACPACRSCGTRHLTVTLANEAGHRFTCPAGVRNFWLSIRVRDEILGIAYLQALKDTTKGDPSESGVRARKGAIVLNRLQFARASRFLEHIVQHVQTASLRDLAEADLSSADRAVVALEREQARLQGSLQRHLTAPIARSCHRESHAEQVVHCVLERLELDYSKPITLGSLARDLGMNCTYLSALFSRTMGIPFKSYLTGLRLDRARQLLGNPATTASEVGFAVGYSSAERFRSAFKKATGLSPRAWRETMQTTAAQHPA